MDHLPDLATATRDAARWELEFVLDPGPSAGRYSMALNMLAIKQLSGGMPDAAVASFIKATEVLGHRTDEDQGELSTALMNATTALIERRDFERALEFSARCVDDARRSGESATHLAFALMERASILRDLERFDEELDARLEALAFFAHPGEIAPELDEDVARLVALNAHRVEELVAERP